MSTSTGRAQTSTGPLFFAPAQPPGTKLRAVARGDLGCRCTHPKAAAPPRGPQAARRPRSPQGGPFFCPITGVRRSEPLQPRFSLSGRLLRSRSAPKSRAPAERQAPRGRRCSPSICY
ncbi:hypothetical protein NDU88_007893 [Pleurodeles waltl]|uniref:Uncharacterized protein n=1 Tax=Pleurodeles waltl TaxID=8319 RepID=A0AAV7PN72_PLEWA|nr:hypothetical protein NDU88_007893 [Pleurodeles waltl]